MSEQGELRFEFGKNWQSYLKDKLSQERMDKARHDLLAFLGKDDLKGMRVLDIGSGSGIHSLAAYDAGAAEVFSFDYDPNSVAATKSLREFRGTPDNWTVCQGSVLDTEFMGSLGTFDLVYSWGVLHHTGSVWQALENAMRCLRADSLFYIALYDSDWSAETPEFWLDIKQRYTAAGSFRRLGYELWYILRFMLGYNPMRFGRLLKRAHEYQKHRGMSLYHDIRDWLGGWPMEYTRIYEVLPLVLGRGNNLLKTKVGEANTEYLFAGKALPPDASRWKPVTLPEPLRWQVDTLRLNDDFSVLDSAKPIYLYGAGKAGDLVRQALARRGLNIAGFITTDGGGSAEGAHLMSLEEFIRSDNREAQIVITSSYFDSISIALANHGICKFYNAFPYALAQLQ
ncbi:hypothetical protein GCM10011352_37300 [Marinobacterium zhoushanense]|uniref:Uncharacterized protein n=1 Tax=Marinobacterium zhoushanense TaxID=1679163 RepID=A0ABQ1KR68_9GAMM|nr:class I SAM-dependent methyltransferase [Marinobacterium zhoushanense]GGC07584.1 hypothetical protein GCM10011352_37300 [Marinobacterium zhoushanense]